MASARAEAEGKQEMTRRKSRVLQGAREALAFAKGEADESAFVIHVPDEIDVKALRRKLKLSQAAFARRYGFNPARIRDWEQGRSRPDGAVRAYLLVIQREPKAVERALAAA
jgi:putative transcriptional regulator